jgi:phospholipase A1/A2
MPKSSYRRVIGPTLFFVLMLAIPLDSWGADIADEVAECAKIDDDTARLRCFDGLAERKRPLTPEAMERTVKDETSREGTVPSVLSRHWDLDGQSRKERFPIRPHRPNYLLPVAYNSTLHQDTALDLEPDARAQRTEAKFQISFKVKVWPDILGKGMDLWFAYTQLAFWQLYNGAFSSPFRETNYEPELLLNFRTDYALLGLRGRMINVGLDHQSNGRSEPLSRSWNRIVGNLGFEKDQFNLLLKTWYRIPETEKDDDNPDILKYLGYGEVWGTYYWHGHRFGLMVRNNLRARGNKGAVQCDWSFPLPFMENDRFSGYIQYFNGYGESLLDYNVGVNRMGIGLMLTDWR